MRISWARPDATAPRSANRFLVPVAGTRRFYNNFRRFRDTQRSRPPAAAAPPGVRPVVRARCSGSASSEGAFASWLALRYPRKAALYLSSDPLLRLLRRNALARPHGCDSKLPAEQSTAPSTALRSRPGGRSTRLGRPRGSFPRDRRGAHSYSTVRRGAVMVTCGRSSIPTNPMSETEKSRRKRTWKSDSPRRCASCMSGVTSIATKFP